MPMAFFNLILGVIFCMTSLLVDLIFPSLLEYFISLRIEKTQSKDDESIRCVKGNFLSELNLRHICINLTCSLSPVLC